MELAIHQAFVNTLDGTHIHIGRLVAIRKRGCAEGKLQEK
jgi:hypothetical protein